MRLAIAVGIGLTAAVVLWGISITLRSPGGKSTRISVPEGSHVAIGDRGQVDVALPGKGSAADEELRRYEKRWGIKRPDQGAAEMPRGGFDPKLAASPVAPGGVGAEAAARSPWIGPDSNWKLPPDAPPPAVAPFDAKKARQHQEAWAKYLGAPVEMSNSIGMRFVLIPPGEFDMGSTSEEIAWALKEGAKNSSDWWYPGRVRNEGPQHRVRITKPFYLAIYPVTQG
jgi:hypothetical protein